MPIVPGVAVFGTPGWLVAPVFVPVVAGADGWTGGVAGETVGPVAAGGGAVCADAANVEPASAAATKAAIGKRCRMTISIV